MARGFPPWWTGLIERSTGWANAKGHIVIVLSWEGAQSVFDFRVGVSRKRTVGSRLEECGRMKRNCGEYGSVRGFRRGRPERRGAEIRCRERPGGRGSHRRREGR